MLNNMRATFYFLLAFFTIAFLGAKKQEPKGEDYINQQVNAKLKKLTDSILFANKEKDSLISSNRNKIIPAIKAKVEENDRLKRENASLIKERDFYKSIAQNPVIIKKEVPLEEQDYNTSTPIQRDTVYLKKKWPFGKYVVINKN